MAAARTDAMASYASLRGPAGMNWGIHRDCRRDHAEKVHSGLKQGRTFVTNGPLLGLEIDGKHPGDEITFSEPRTLPYHASLRSIVPIDHFELIFNARVIASHCLEGARTQADVTGNIEIPASGWLVLRAWNDHADPKADAAYFVSWLDRVITGAAARSDYNNPQEKQTTAPP
jgi:TolB protein